MTDRSEWEGRVGRTWAEQWRRTDRAFAPLTDRLLAVAGGQEPGRILDVGCGAGELSLALGRKNPDARVVGVDVSEPLLETARARAGNLPNVTFVHGDAAGIQLNDLAPELVVSRHGVMFFADPVAAFAHLASISKPDARLLFSCFRSVSENAWASELAALVPASASSSEDPNRPGPFAFADPLRVHSLLEAAGWSGIEFEKFDFPYVAGTGEDAVSDARSFFLAVGPAARAAAGLQGEARSEFLTRLNDLLESRLRAGLVAFPAAAWIVTARKAAG